MAPPKPPARPQAKLRGASPAERSTEFAAHQQRLKDEAAERRRLAGPEAAATPRPRRAPNKMNRG